MGRSTLMTQLFGQAQDVVTIATFAVGLVLYAPWLIALLLLALVPAFLGEAHFNAQSYSLNYSRTPERREIDYVRQTGASVETAKEVKIFGLNAFLIERYRAWPPTSTMRTAASPSARRLGRRAHRHRHARLLRRIRVHRVAHVTGALTIGDLTFLAGSFRRLRNLLEGCSSGSRRPPARRSTSTTCSPSSRSSRRSAHRRSPAVPVADPRGIPFDDVGFRYPGAERWAVRNLSFTLRAGEVLALVGENGAGKTTLVKLLTRLYDPDEGGSCSTATTCASTTWTSSARTWASSSRTSSATT
jgi:ATP-binding cassette, subfamily B, bacterial